MDDEYGSIQITFLKSVMLTTGELDFNDTFITRDVFYPYLYFFWIVFVIVMAIVFNNLLVGYCTLSLLLEYKKIVTFMKKSRG